MYAYASLYLDYVQLNILQEFLQCNTMTHSVSYLQLLKVF